MISVDHCKNCQYQRLAIQWSKDQPGLKAYEKCAVDVNLDVLQVADVENRVDVVGVVAKDNACIAATLLKGRKDGRAVIDGRVACCRNLARGDGLEVDTGKGERDPWESEAKQEADKGGDPHFSDGSLGRADRAKLFM